MAIRYLDKDNYPTIEDVSDAYPAAEMIIEPDIYESNNMYVVLDTHDDIDLYNHTN